MDDHEAVTYWREEVIPALQPILADLVRRRPENPLQYVSDELIAYSRQRQQSAEKPDAEEDAKVAHAAKMRSRKHTVGHTSANPARSMAARQRKHTVDHSTATAAYAMSLRSRKHTVCHSEAGPAQAMTMRSRKHTVMHSSVPLLDARSSPVSPIAAPLEEDTFVQNFYPNELDGFDPAGTVYAGSAIRPHAWRTSGSDREGAYCITPDGRFFLSETVPCVDESGNALSHVKGLEVYGRGSIEGIQEVLHEGSQMSHFLLLINGTFLLVWTPGTYGDPFRSLDPRASESLAAAMKSSSAQLAGTEMSSSSSSVFHDATYQIDRVFDPRSLKPIGITCDVSNGPPPSDVIAEWCYRQCELADDDETLDFYALDWREHAFPARLLDRARENYDADADADADTGESAEDED